MTDRTKNSGCIRFVKAGYCCRSDRRSEGGCEGEWEGIRYGDAPRYAKGLNIVVRTFSFKKYLCLILCINEGVCTRIYSARQ